ncbi:response regulator [Actinoplanes friuliensis]|uniref:Putative response regulator receiver domain protein n=1 Tax=Actinoplanes friuliensis DSM 7358 TaxID=1246995 RepID=U5VRQ4_9ACTN|nr:response regulator [Actinoplanes friuliensis]AGZ39497.1 putative response regulator receiver domain protein [Actinoplanes friuliensis DSM 7358]
MAAVLIAEDDEEIAFILTRVLKRAGHVVHHAPDGVAALALASQIRPQVVLTDLGMPRMDGLELSRSVREHPDLRDTPIAILTGSLLPEDPRAVAAAPCAVLLKPCANDDLRLAVQQLAELGPHDHSTASSACPFRLAALP